MTMMALKTNPVGMTNDKFMKLLIVEDNPQMRRLIKSVVSDISDEVAECGDGADALKAYTDFHPDWGFDGHQNAEYGWLNCNTQYQKLFSRCEYLHCHRLRRLQNKGCGPRCGS